MGGLAVSARTEPRFTRDVDVAVAVPGDPEAEALVRSLSGSGYLVLAQVEQEDTRRLAQVRLVPPGGAPEAFVLDLLFASSGIEPEIVAAADVIEVLEGFRVPVASTGHLLALKVLSFDDRSRPQDRADIRALLRTAEASDVETCRRALGLIGTRGFARGRKLLEDLEGFLRDGPA